MAERMPAHVRRWSMAAAMACLLPLLLEVRLELALGLALLAAVGIAVQRPWPTLPRLLMVVLVIGYVLASHRFSIGRDTGTALLAAMLVLKIFETTDLRGARSLLGFSLFAPFAAFLQDQGPLAMALAFPAVGLLLLALSVLAEHHAGAPAPAFDRRRAGLAAAAIGMSLPLALAGFWLFPRLGSPLWGMPENAVGRSGLSDRMTPDQWVETFAADEPALRVRFPGEVPRPADLYWRAQVLWDFDGRTWSRGEVRVAGQPPPIRPLSPTLRYEVSLEPNDRRYYPVLDTTLGAPEGSELGSDLTVRPDRPVTSVVRYDAVAAVRAEVGVALDAREERAALSLPAGLNPRTRELAARWREEAGGDNEAVVRRALQWIGDEFSYSLTVPPSGRDAVDDFLFETRVGFCQHFSSAFATLMRGAGIPSRVVIGYAGGYRNRYGDYWVVRGRDAHAWNEVWLDGRGWVRVDPTAAVAPSRILDTVDDLAQAESLLPDTFSPLRDMGDWMRRGWNDFVLGFNAARQASLLRPLGVDQADTWQLGTAFAVGAGLALGITLWVLMRGRPTPRHPVEAAWLALLRRLRRAGIDKPVHEPPLSFAARLAGLWPQAAAPMEALSRRYADWRYAPGRPTPAEEAQLARDLRAFRPTAKPPGATP
jgi:transglutaminase-like putative cysteine protease